MVWGFNTSYVSVQEHRIRYKLSTYRVSIHPMCRFKCYVAPNNDTNPEFQYILCVGSRFANKAFETSSKEFQYILCVGSSHADRFYRNVILWFQYILCVGSRVYYIDKMEVQDAFQYILCVGSRDLQCVKINDQY